MTEEHTNFIGNSSTIIKIISMMIAGWFIGILAANGLNLGVDESTLTKIIGTIIFLIIAYIDARFPNTLNFFKNQPKQQQLVLKEIVLNEDYETNDNEEEDEVNGT